MKTKMLPITIFAKTEPIKKLTIEQIRTQLTDADAVWPFGWY